MVLDFELTLILPILLYGCLLFTYELLLLLNFLIFLVSSFGMVCIGILLVFWVLTNGYGVLRAYLVDCNRRYNVIVIAGANWPQSYYSGWGGWAYGPITQSEDESVSEDYQIRKDEMVLWEEAMYICGGPNCIRGGCSSRNFCPRWLETFPSP